MCKIFYNLPVAVNAFLKLRANIYNKSEEALAERQRNKRRNSGSTDPDDLEDCAAWNGGLSGGEIDFVRQALVV